MMNVDASIFEEKIWKNKDHRRRSLPGDLLSSVSKYIEEYTKTNALDSNQALMLEYIRGILLEENEDILIAWFSTYRCALLAKLNQGCRQKPMRNLTLLGLSGHRMQLQHEWSSKPTQTVDATSFDVISIKPVESENYETLLKSVEEQLEDIYKQDARQSLGRHKKMTPALIELVLNQAHLKLAGISDDVVIPLKGGWSDVLHHTGGEWPLLSAVIEHLATMSPHYTINSRSLHQHFVCHLQMNALKDTKNTLLPSIEDAKKTDNIEATAQINKLMIMISSIARKTVEELVDKYKVKEIETLLAETRKQIEESVNRRFGKVSRFYQLYEKDDRKSFSWSINISNLRPIVANTDYQQILERSRSNIGSLPILNTNDISEILKYVEILEEEQPKDKIVTANLILSTIHNFIFSQALRLDDPDYRVAISGIEKIVQKYRLWNRAVLAHVKGKACESIKPCLTVELLSNEALVTWIGFALVHKTLKKSIPILQRYGQPLDWSRVSHFVLSHKNGFDAALHVSKYLGRNSKIDGNLFCLSLDGSQRETLQFALEIASQSPELLKIWHFEAKEARRRENEHWDKILKQQQEVFDLEETLKKEKEDLEMLQKEKLTCRTSSLQWNNFSERINRLRSKIILNEGLLKVKKIPPDPVFQPLPQDKDQGLKLLFFLHMPQELKLLTRLAISAQQILIPVEDFAKHSALALNHVNEIDQKIAIETSSWTSLTNYYNEHLPSQQSFDQALHPFSNAKPPKPGHIGPKCIKEFSSSSQAVWHPDNMFHFVLWKGGEFPLNDRKGYFNPSFQIDKNFLSEYFTEKIDSKFQYTLTLYGKQTNGDRSNIPIANQNDKPACLGKFSWLRFASLRAYPKQQLRKLCCILSENSLPLNEPIVHTLIRQTLYQIGCKD